MLTSNSLTLVDFILLSYIMLASSSTLANIRAALKYASAMPHYIFFKLTYLKPTQLRLSHGAAV